MDVATYPDLDVTGAELSERASVVEAFRRGLQMDYGALDYTPESGFLLCALLSRRVDRSDIYTIESGIESQALRDERVDECKATVTLSDDGSKLRGRVHLTTTSGENITLNLSATQLEVTVFDALVP